MTPRTLNNQDGIALGPILFIIAILAILAAAIAAGGGSFNANTTTESIKAQAGTLIQIGDTLRSGMDNLVSNGIDPASVVFDPTVTTGTVSLFSPQGGAIGVPSETALCSSCFVTSGGTNRWPFYTFHWFLQWGTFAGFGTGVGNTYIVFAPVSAAVCTEVNQLANNQSTPSSTNLGAMTGNGANQVPSAFPSALRGKMVGCLNDNNGNSTGYFFYQVLLVQ